MNIMNIYAIQDITLLPRNVRHVHACYSFTTAPTFSVRPFKGNILLAVYCSFPITIFQFHY